MDLHRRGQARSRLLSVTRNRNYSQKLNNLWGDEWGTCIRLFPSLSGLFPQGRWFRRRTPYKRLKHRLFPCSSNCMNSDIRISLYVPIVDNCSNVFLFQCNAAVGVKAFFDMMHSGPHKVMLFGAACTHVTDPIAKASKHWRLTQVRLYQLFRCSLFSKHILESAETTHKNNCWIKEDKETGRRR